MLIVTGRMVQAAIDRLAELDGPLHDGIAELTWGQLATALYEAMEHRRREDELFPPEITLEEATKRYIVAQNMVNEANRVLDGVKAQMHKAAGEGSA